MTNTKSSTQSFSLVQGSAFTTEHGTCVPVKTINGSQYSVQRSKVIGMYFDERVQRSTIIGNYFAERKLRSAVIGMYFAVRVQRSVVLGMYIAEQCSAFCGVPSMLSLIHI